MTKRNADRRIETGEIFVSILKYLAKTRRQRPEERINITADASLVIDHLIAMRNVLVLPPKTKAQLRDFTLYSMLMLQHFSLGALRDWIVREFLEATAHATGRAREGMYNGLRYHLFPKSKRSGAKMVAAIPFYAHQYDVLFKQLTKLLAHGTTVSNSVLLLKEKLPGYKSTIEFYNTAVESALCENQVSKLTHILLSPIFKLSYNSAPKILTKSRKYLSSK